MAKATSDGIIYGPNVSGKSYISLYYHRATKNPHKNTWAKPFAPDLEYALFCSCDANGWVCENGNFWGIVDGGSVLLGAKGERLSFCPANGNATNPWHGYPIFSSDVDHRVPEAIVTSWETQGLITKIGARRIRGGKL